MEDYFSFSYYLRTAKVQLPKKILEGETVTWRELNFLKDLDLNKTYEYLLLPNVDYFQALEEGEKEIVMESAEIREFTNRRSTLTKNSTLGLA